VSSVEEQFRLGAFTRPFGDFPLEEAFAGIAEAGFKYAGLMIRHQKDPSLPSAGGSRSVEEISTMVSSAGLTLTSITCCAPSTGARISRTCSIGSPRRHWRG